jgi:hypothetical protein
VKSGRDKELKCRGIHHVFVLKKYDNFFIVGWAVLCCSSLSSSDVRNCNKRVIENHNLDTAQMVWQGVVDLGVEGEEVEDRYVERIPINDNRDDAARLLREQNQRGNP